jgi:hypothetical protein
MFCVVLGKSVLVKTNRDSMKCAPIANTNGVSFGQRDLTGANDAKQKLFYKRYQMQLLYLHRSNGVESQK